MSDFSTKLRRSRRLSSQEPEVISACSSTNVSEVFINDHASRMMKSNDETKRIEQTNIGSSQQNDSSLQNSPIAFRTRSRCSSMESNDAGIVEDIRKAANIVLTPVKKLMTPVKSCRKRTSLMPPLEEIAEEALKCKNENSDEGQLIERKTKKVLKKKGRLSESGKEHDEFLGEGSPAERSNGENASAEDVAGEEGSAEVEEKIIKKSRKKSRGKPTRSPVKVPAKLLIGNSKKTLKDDGNYCLQDTMKVSPAKNAESLVNIQEESSAASLSKFPGKHPEEVLTNGSSFATDYLGQEAKIIKDTNLKENAANIFPEFEDLSSLWLRRSEQSLFVDKISKAYAFVNELDTGVPTISQELITTDSEMIWQQIVYGNKKFHRYFAKMKRFMDVEIPEYKKSAKKRDDSHSSSTTPAFPDNSSNHTEDDGSEKDDLFNLTEDEIKRLEDDNTGENDKNHGNLSSDEDIVSEASENGSKRWKSAVDDRFFSLAEMEEYLDKQEKDQANSEGNLFEQFDKDVDDLQNSHADCHYADFYGSSNNFGKENGPKTASKKLKESKKVLQCDPLNRVEKRVTFADEISGDDENNDGDSCGDVEEKPVLLGLVDEKVENETEFQRRQRKLQDRILSIEQANLAPRRWDLSGEVTAMEREENTMLEKHFDFDQSAPCAPIITIDTTDKLEAKIIQRIKDKLFDDVLRTERKALQNPLFRAPVAEQEIVKKSLGEVYEEQYQKTQGAGKEEKKNEKHEEIKKLVSELFQKLNALCHYRYIPPEVQQEVKIINNMPSLQKEEVGPLASTDAVLLAPEEIHKHINAPIKGDDEKTKTDRSRLHRKKKKWQHLRQLQKQEVEFTSTNETPAKKAKLVSRYDSKGSKKLTSTAFFKSLQAKAEEEVKGKKHKSTELGAKRKKLSTNYKL